MFRILFLGDVVGKPGRKVLKENLSALKKELSPNLTIVNGENSAGGLGIEQSTAEEIYAAGADVITTGNHVWGKKDFHAYLDKQGTRLVRPANYSAPAPGVGFCLWKSPENISVAVINAIGRVFMPDLVDCPFRKLDEILSDPSVQSANLRFVDFHAEVTSEKIAMSYHLDGRASVLVGTHTHVQTADNRVLPGGLAYLTDAGMCGPRDGVIGMEKEPVLQKFLSGRPAKFDVASGATQMNGLVADCDESTGRAISIERIFRVFEPITSQG